MRLVGTVVALAVASLSAAAPPIAAKRPPVTLDAHGLILGASRRIAFGTPQPAALAALGVALGHGEVTREPEECGMGRTAMHADFANGLQLQFQHGRLIGWTVEGKSSLRTADGLGLGTPRATLVRAHPRVTFEDTETLGYQFSVPGGIDGGLTDSGPAARIDFLSAGSHCVIS